MRGERFVAVTGCVAILGSSPRTLGTLRPGAWPAQKDRFIPACAGNARSTIGSRPSGSVHPRVGGERMACMAKTPAVVGSSLHTRGTPGRVARIDLVARFIPAYAGNATSAALGGGSHPVHPRIRGERSTPVYRIRHPPGSSPHTRGTLLIYFSPDLRMRFIPAYAGNAFAAQATRLFTTVHPRIRGERTADQIAQGKVYGSSPHTRGTLPRKIQHKAIDRFIPAYAGNASVGTV